MNKNQKLILERYGHKEVRSNKTKYIILYTVLFLLFICAILVFTYIYSNSEHPDRYGYIHNPADMVYEDTDIDLIKVPLSKTAEDNFLALTKGKPQNTYAFVSEIKPRLTSAKSTYMSFVLSDGSAVYFTVSSPDKGIYGSLSDNGFLDTDYGYVYLSGMNASYEPAPGYTTDLSKRIAALVPDQYKTDGFYVETYDGECIIHVKADNSLTLQEHADLIYSSVRSFTDYVFTIYVNHALFEY